jgi:hypothetical protein
MSHTTSGVCKVRDRPPTPIASSGTPSPGLHGRHVGAADSDEIPTESKGVDRLPSHRHAGQQHPESAWCRFQFK